MKQLYTIGIAFIFMMMSCFSYALKLTLPGDGGQSDLHVKSTSINGQESDIITIIKMVNEYLWFFVGLVGLLLLAYAGIKIITAQGDKKQVSDSYNLIIAAIVMIFVAILSYVIVKLLVNLF